MIAHGIQPIAARVLARMIDDGKLDARGWSHEVLGSLARHGLCKIRNGFAYPTAAGITALGLFLHHCCEHCGGEKAEPTERFCSPKCKADRLVAEGRAA